MRKHQQLIIGLLHIVEGFTIILTFGNKGFYLSTDYTMWVLRKEAEKFKKGTTNETL